LVLRDPLRLLGIGIAALIAVLALSLALSPAVQAADQPADQTSPFVAQDADDDDDDGITDDDDDAVTDDDDDAIIDDDDDETPAPAETGTAGSLGGVAAGQNAIPQDADDDDNGLTDDDDDGITDDEDDGVLDDDDDETPAPAETGSAGLLGGQGTGSTGLFMLLAGGALALLSGARFALSRR
jgi:hypothetical protein